MLNEDFVTSTYSAANASLPKDAGLYVHTLHPVHAIKSTFKKSSTQPNGLAISSTHIFAAQAEKAVVHVYSRERGNQETLIAFPERIQSLSLVHEGLLALGTTEGRIILWEYCTGRQVETLSSHLQAVSCLAATPSHLISGSEDSNVHVWSIPRLLSFTSAVPHEPSRSFSSHRGPITSIALGHSATRSNICISASKDNTCMIWNYHTGDVLRTILLYSTPLCIALDPCDRAFYIGFDNGTIHPIDLVAASTTTNLIHGPAFASGPIQQNPSPFTGSPSEVGAVHCLALSYDGTAILSGHSSGRLLSWSTGPRKFATELADLSFPITNLIVLDPFPPSSDTRQRDPAIAMKPVNVVKPRVGETLLGSYTLTAQLGSLDSINPGGDFESASFTPGIPTSLLEAAILEVTNQLPPSSAVASQDVRDAELLRLRNENDDLWHVVSEQRALQKRTFESYLAAKHGSGTSEEGF